MKSTRSAGPTVAQTGPMLPKRRPRPDDADVTRVPTGDEIVGAMPRPSEHLAMPSSEIDISEATLVHGGGDVTVVPRGDATLVARTDLHWDQDEELTRIDPPSDPEISISEAEAFEVHEFGDPRSVSSERTTLKRPDRGDEKS